MHKAFYYTIFLFLVILSGCAGTTTFRVLDAETKKPVEGAVAIAMWRKNKGFFGGFELSTYTAKAIEAVSDKGGYLTFPAVSGSYATYTPHVKVYKPGYVGWDSKLIYLGIRGDDIKSARYKRRESFSMKNQDIFLHPWKDEYSFISHSSFISSNANLRKAGIPDSKYEKSIEFESYFYRKEMDLLHKEKK